jgi:hypothetical protein
MAELQDLHPATTMAKKKAAPPKTKRGRPPLPDKIKRGRPPLPDNEKKSKPFQIKLSKEDLRLINAAAALDEHKPYPWARSMLVQAARQRLQEAGAALPPPEKNAK